MYMCVHAYILFILYLFISIYLFTYIYIYIYTYNRETNNCVVNTAARMLSTNVERTDINLHLK